MKKILGFITVIVCIAAFSSVASAAPSANQTVSFSVSAINHILVSGNPAALAINTATGGQNPDDATDASTTYSATTNSADGKIITAQINEAMPGGLTLKVALAGTGTTGIQTLGTEPVAVVTGLSKTTRVAQTITYTLSATAAAEAVSTSKIVTFTITNH